MQANFRLNRLPASSHRNVSVKTAAGKGFGTPKIVKKPTVSSPPIVDPCPCQSGKNYKDLRVECKVHLTHLQNCCQKVHDSEVAAATPEAALRARFSAFIRNRPDHVISTTHPDYFPYHYNKPASDEEAQMKFAADVEQGCTKFVYTDFKVVQTEPGSIEDEGFVAFSYKCAKAPANEDEAIPEEAWSMTDEKCRFLRVNGVWQFVDYQEYTRNLTQLITQVQQQQAKKTSSEQPPAPAPA